MEDVPCCNFEVCGEYTDCQLKSCSNCDFRRIVNGKKEVLSFRDNIECPVCLETKRGVTNINCEHYVCIDCFKKLHEFVQDDNGPPFPYSEETETDYYENPEKYSNDPAIKTWLECEQVYFREVDEENAKRQNLRLCPLCRQ